MTCNNRLEVKYLLPIISYLYHKGKCPFCRKEIGISTLLWEVGIGLPASVLVYLLDINSGIYILAGTWSIAIILQLIMRVK